MDILTPQVASFCSGTGGMDLGLSLALPAARTVVYVEREAFACEILATRMEEGILADAPIWTDITTFDPRPWRGKVDIIIGGYPCQPFSIAGKRRGTDDTRNIWADIRRAIEQIRPAQCFFENVSNHLRLGFYNVAYDLQKMGYTVAAGLFSAEEVGAPHRRERLFILADAFCPERRKDDDTGGYSFTRSDYKRKAAGRPGEFGPYLADAPGEGLPIRTYAGQLRQLPPAERTSAFPPGPDGDWAKYDSSLKPAICGVVDGLASRNDRLRALGNGCVPLVAAYAYATLTKALTGEQWQSNR